MEKLVKIGQALWRANVASATMAIMLSKDVSRLLVIDDDSALCSLVARYLSGEGFRVDSVHSGTPGVERALSGDYSLVVLDVMMPDMNGFEVLRRIRAQSPLPVLMLTAKGEPLDRVHGLEAGADDYLPKPFNPKELAARIRAILRRAASAANAASIPGTARIIGDVEVDAGARVVRRRGELIGTTTVEFDLLVVLVRSAGQIVDREKLSREVLGREFSPFDRSIDTHVCNLRKKLGPLDDGGERIKGIRGAGYLYAVPGKH
jgi:DNA-binding response OmpR family regulator